MKKPARIEAKNLSIVVASERRIKAPAAGWFMTRRRYCLLDACERLLLFRSLYFSAARKDDGYGDNFAGHVAFKTDRCSDRLSDELAGCGLGHELDPLCVRRQCPKLLASLADDEHTHRTSIITADKVCELSVDHSRCRGGRCRAALGDRLRKRRAHSRKRRHHHAADRSLDLLTGMYRKRRTLRSIERMLRDLSKRNFDRFQKLRIAPSHYIRRCDLSIKIRSDAGILDSPACPARVVRRTSGQLNASAVDQARREIVRTDTAAKRSLADDRTNLAELEHERAGLCS